MPPPLHGPWRSALAATGLRSRAQEHPDIGGLARPGRAPSARAVLAELGSGLAAARLAGALPRLLAAPRGDGHPVVDIPGWKAPELSGAPLRAYLRALGYDARGWGSGPTPVTHAATWNASPGELWSWPTTLGRRSPWSAGASAA